MPLRELPEPKGPLAERKTADGRRRLQLNKEEREIYQRSETIDRLVLMILSIEDNLTYREMADELEISVPSLKNLTRTEEFQDRYNEHFMQLGQDPRVEITQARIAELLPQAFLTMQTALTGVHVPWTVKRDVAFKIMELSGIKKPQVTQNDRKEIQRFFEEKSETKDGITITIPESYMDAMQVYKRGENIDNEVSEEVVDGEYSDVGNED